MGQAVDGLQSRAALDGHHLAQGHPGFPLDVGERTAQLAGQALQAGPEPVGGGDLGHDPGRVAVGTAGGRVERRHVTNLARREGRRRPSVSRAR